MVGKPQWILGSFITYLKSMCLTSVAIGMFRTKILQISIQISLINTVFKICARVLVFWDILLSYLHNILLTNDLICISFPTHTVSRMLRSSCGSSWTGFIQKLTIIHPNILQLRKLRTQHTDDSGTLQRERSWKDHMYLESFRVFQSLIVSCRISEEAFAMWQRHLDRDDSKIVGKQ